MQGKINKYLLNTLIFLTILIIIYFSRRAFFIDLERIIFFTVCLVLTVLFFFLILFIKFQSKKIQTNFLIFFFSSLVSIYLLETMLFKLNYNKSHFQFLENIRAAKINKMDFDKRSIYKFYEDFKKNKKEDSVLAMSRTLIKIDNKIVQTLGGIGNRETVLCNEMGNWITYKSDRYGFNNPDALWEKELDLIILGDSYGLGLCVNQNQNFAGAMREKNKKAITLGGTGMGTLFEYAIFKEYAKKVKADNLVFLFLLNDLDNLSSELSNPILLNYLEDNAFSQNLATNQNKINIRLEEKLHSHINTKKFLTIKRIIKLHHLRDIIKTIIRADHEDKIFTSFKIDKYKLEKAIKIFTKAKDEFEGNLYIGYLPLSAEYMFDQNERKKLKKMSDEVIKAFKENNLDVIDFRLVLDEKKVEEIIPFGNIVRAENHYTPLGFNLISNQIINYIYK